MAGKKFLGLALFFFLIVSYGTDARGLERSAVLLDLGARRGESDSKRFSLEHALRVAGIPYVVTDSVDTACQHAVIIASSEVFGSTLLPGEVAALNGYVAGGGIWVVPGVGTRVLFGLFGLCGVKYADTRYTLTWNTESLDPSLRWFDDPNERTISLGRATSPRVIGTRGYSPGGATPLASFEDGSAAVTRHAYGKGIAYALGFSFKDLLLRNQLNRDFEAQRTYSNGFEPTSDTVILFMRAVFQAALPFATWKHTSPGISPATLMITHDVDSTSGMLKMESFSRMESARGIGATYTITTHYEADKLLSAFYPPNVFRVQSLVAAGHEIASHSVGHFPDFGSPVAFPEGAPGNGRESYHPYHDGTQTVGGSVYGELEVSKALLETDTGVPVSAFRSGHLYWNKAQVKVLDQLGYRFDSSRSANDVLTNFPYRCRVNNSFTGAVSHVYEIPMTLSDARMTMDNTADKVTAWLDVIRRNAGNLAPTVLLIHPNRDYKLAAEADLIERLPAGMALMPLGAFGDFWANRDALRFTTRLEGNELTITIDTGGHPIDPRLSLIVDEGSTLAGVVVQNEAGGQIPFLSSPWHGSGIILHSIGSSP